MRSMKARLIIALVMMLFAAFSYFTSSEINPVTGQKQYVALTPDQEIALGLNTAPEMARQFGGLSRDMEAQALVDAVGQKLVKNSAAGEQGWNFEFHVLADDQTVNAFALPGGQIFITQALYDRLSREDQLAGILGHEIGHVIARHGAQQMAKQQLTQGLTSAAVIASGDYSAGQIAQMAGQFINMKYGRKDELESDFLGLNFMAKSGYDPTALIEVMQILQEATGGAGGPPEFFSTHPHPEHRIEEIKKAIETRSYENLRVTSTKQNDIATQNAIGKTYKLATISDRSGTISFDADRAEKAGIFISSENGQTNLTIKPGETVKNIDGLTLRLYEGAISQINQLPLTISRLNNPFAGNPSLAKSVEPIGRFYKLSAKDFLMLDVDNPLEIAIPVPEGTNTKHLAIAILQLGTPVLLRDKKSIREWQYSLSTYNSETKLLSTTLSTLSTEGIVFGIVSNSYFETDEASFFALPAILS
jgi:Zn-dependent protease with chaperone function